MTATAVGARSGLVHRTTSLSYVVGPVALAGFLMAVAGFVVGRQMLVLAGVSVAGVAALIAAVIEPAWFILVFVIVRPVLDLGRTYEQGPSLNSAAGAVLLLALGSWAWQHRSVIATPSASVWAAALLGVAGLLSAMGSHDQLHSTDMALRLGTIAALFAVSEQIGRLDHRFLTRLLGAVVGSAVLAGLVALAQVVDLLALPDIGRLGVQQRRPTGPYPAPTVLATHLFIALSLLLVIVPRLWSSSRWRNLVPHAMLLSVALSWILMENQSRGPLVALLVVAAGFATLRWRWLGLTITMMLVLATASVFDPGSTRFDEFASSSKSEAETDTLAWRVDYWTENLPRFTDSPLTGIGLGRVEQIHIKRAPPHSTVVQSIVEMGVAGALAYGGFVVFLGRDLWRAVARTRRTSSWDVTVAIALMCVGYGCIGLFENLLTQTVTSGPVALLAGAAIAGARSDSISPRGTAPACRARPRPVSADARR